MDGSGNGGTARILAGFLLLFVVLDGSARLLSSHRGEAGLAVLALVLAAALLVEGLLFGRTPRDALRALGLVAPGMAGLAAALGLAVLLVAFLVAVAGLSGLSPGIADGWALLALGLFAQGGLAEETVFRGYLFRHLRVGRSFWRAAVVAALPFVAVHLLLFASLAPVVAAASLLLAVSISFPLAWLFERSGGSVWPPAIVHAVVQGAIKLIVVPEAALMPLAVAWIAVAAVAPWSLFLVLRAPRRA